MKITKRQLRRIIREAEGSTKKYDDDSALKGGQSKLPDGLQKSIIDKAVEDREEHEEEEREEKQEKNESIRITKRQLKRVIREAIDIINSENGEVFEFGPEGLPDEAWPDLQRRLGITPVDPSPDAGVAYATDPDGIEVSSEDFYKLTDEVEGKRWKRKRTAKERRLNPVTLRDRLDKWAEDARSDYVADNPDVDMQGIARDLAASAEHQFEWDEWEALVADFDYDESALLDYAADVVAG